MGVLFKFFMMAAAMTHEEPVGKSRDYAETGCVACASYEKYRGLSGHQICIRFTSDSDDGRRERQTVFREPRELDLRVSLA